MIKRDEALTEFLEIVRSVLSNTENTYKEIRIISNPKVKVGVPKDCKGQLVLVVVEGSFPVIALRNSSVKSIYEHEQDDGGIAIDLLYG